MKFMQKLGKSLMLPVSVLPICGILLGIGYLLCPNAVQGGEINGVAQTIGFFLNKAGSAIINNMAILFVIGVSMGMAEEQHGIACLAGLVSWLEITTLLSSESVSAMIPSMSAEWIMTFDKIANPFIGILSGLIGAFAYNRFRKVKLPDVLAFFSGKRFVAIATTLISLLVSVVLLVMWPIVFMGMCKLGEAIMSLGGIGAGIYVFLNRLLIPTGLHHALNNVFWFDTIGLGDLTLFWAGKTSQDVSWSLGMYMSGFFPCMMFGVPGAALAMIHTAKNRKKTSGILGSSSVCSILCGLTEPFEFSFMFASFPLYVVYSFLYGVFTVIAYYTGFRAGFSFSGGGIDLLLSAAMPAAQNTWQIIPLGAAAFVTFYGVFRLVITKFNLKTPGREEEDAEAAPVPVMPKTRGDNKYAVMARAFLHAVGGKANVESADCCATRLRLSLHDSSLVRDAEAKAAGAVGVMKPDGKTCQIIVGMTVQQVLDEFRIAMTEDAPEAVVSAAETTEKEPPVRALHLAVAPGSHVTAGQVLILPDHAEPFTHVIQDPVGIHARPAGEIVKLLQGLNCRVTVKCGDKQADGASILEWMKLGAVKGSAISVSAEGADAGTALKRLKKYMDEKL